ncbi:c-type cytochrome [soil metagenome]
MDTICKQSKKHFLTIFSLLFLSFFLSINSVSAQADGEKIFKQNCAVCHSMSDAKVTGPGLKGVMTRVPSEDWLKKWIKNNKALIAAGDAYAVKVFAANNNLDMTSFTAFTDEELDAVVGYIKSYKPPVAPVASGGGASGNGGAKEEGINPMNILIGIIAFLIIIVSVLRGVRHSLKNIQNEKAGIPEEEKIGAWTELKNWISANKTTTGVVILFIVGGLMSAGWYALKDIGIYANPETKLEYNPEQPIAFNHKLHAGDNAINCQYCHSGVERSKTAGIPTVNVCMNCHKGIPSGPTTGTTEIAKIYEAAGYDPASGLYSKPQKPIRWVKVHNLQDFVFFSHQQHVKVGKQECVTCHGDLKEMTTARQVQPLTMAWCIDCHKKTEVPGMKDNPYYESLHKKLAEKFKDLPRDQRKFTVDKMGGIECGKCHY